MPLSLDFIYGTDKDENEYYSYDDTPKIFRNRFTPNMKRESTASFKSNKDFN